MVGKCQDIFSLGRLNLIPFFHCSKLCSFSKVTIVMDATAGIQPFKNNATFPICSPNIHWPSPMI